jgi:dual specificity tyrosine-phosphorylation-regulated kinase 2/3/4
VFELLGKNLYQELKESEFLGLGLETKVKPIVFQIIQGLIYLKHCQVIHCDLKPENLMYRDSRRKDVKIIDFGSSSSFG